MRFILNILHCPLILIEARVIVAATTLLFGLSCSKTPNPACVNTDECSVFAQSQELAACEEVRCMGGKCAVVPQLSGSQCDDGEPCTEGDYCSPDSICNPGPKWICVTDVLTSPKETLNSDTANQPNADSMDSNAVSEDEITIGEAVVISDTNHAINYPPIVLTNEDGTSTAYYAAMDKDLATSSIRARVLDSMGFPTGPSTEIYLHGSGALYPSSGSVGFNNFLTLYDQGANDLRIWQVDSKSQPDEKAIITNISSSLTYTLPFFSSAMVSYQSKNPAEGGALVHISPEDTLNSIYSSGINAPLHIAESANEIFGLGEKGNDENLTSLHLFLLSDGERPSILIESEAETAQASGICITENQGETKIYLARSNCGDEPSTHMYSVDKGLSTVTKLPPLNERCTENSKRIPFIPLSDGRIFSAWFQDGDLILSSFRPEETERPQTKISGFQNEAPADLFMANAPKWAQDGDLIFWPGVVESSEPGRIYDAVIWTIQIPAE